MGRVFIDVPSYDYTPNIAGLVLNVEGNTKYTDSHAKHQTAENVNLYRLQPAEIAASERNGRRPKQQHFYRRIKAQVAMDLTSNS